MHLLVPLLCTAALAGGVTPYVPPSTGDAWETVDPAALGWEVAGLPALDAFLDDTGTQAFVVLVGGRIAHERTFDGWGLHDTRPVYSVTKSVTATLLGRLEADGLLDLDDPVSTYLGVGWSAATPAQELAITIRDAAAMQSGLDDAFAFVAAPGTVWHYNTPVYRELLDVIESASGLTRSGYFQATLSEPLGMQDTDYAPSGEFLQASARDLARFGLMIARGGQWASQTVVDAAHVAEMRTPSQDLNPSYGLLWWLNGQDSWILPNGTSGTGPVIPTAPGDTTAALGASDQKVYVVPSLDAVVVRVGDSAGLPQGDYDRELWEHLARVMTPATFCDAGDDALLACPCANPGDALTGCDLAQGTGGVRLSLVDQRNGLVRRATWLGMGFPAAGAPTAILIRSQERLAAPVTFGDGLRCVGTPVVRLGAAFASGGTSRHEHGHGLATGDFHYQLWFRNTPGSACTPDAFNLSNGRTLGW